jgi:hypothetical protein
MRPHPALAPLLVLLFAACGASGMDRATTPRPSDTPPVVDDPSVAAILQRQAQLPARPRVAVWLVPDPRFDWDFEDTTALVEAAPEGAELFPLLPSALVGGDPQALRLEAARHGADAILLVQGFPEQSRASNGWAAAYALLLPVLFAPGGELHTRFRVEARLVDVGNRYLYATALAETERHQTAPHPFLDAGGQLEAARSEAVAELTEELGARLGRVLGPGRPDASQRTR